MTLVRAGALPWFWTTWLTRSVLPSVTEVVPTLADFTWRSGSWATAVAACGARVAIATAPQTAAVTAVSGRGVVDMVPR